jgi:hypothetical protein
MNTAHWHFIFNHIPILGTLFGVCILADGLMRKDKSLENTGLIIFVIVALFTIPAFLTGEAAEEVAEEIEGVSHYLIHEHEEMAEKALWLMMALGSFSLFAIIYSKIKQQRITFVKVIALLVGMGIFTMMVFVGNSGGEIRHSEIRKIQELPQDHPEEHK